MSNPGGLAHIPDGYGYCPSLTLDQIHAYLERIGISPSAATLPPSLELLSTLQLNHLCTVPFETTPCHLPANWGNPDRAGRAVSIGGRIPENSDAPELMPGNAEDAYRRIVEFKRGGYCFSLNAAFSRLLRSMGFNVSDVAARTYIFRSQDPMEKGYDWTPLTHQCMFVSWPDAKNTRYLVDVGFGGGSSPYPIALEHGVEIGSTTPGERFRLKNEILPGANVQKFLSDSLVGWTIERWVSKSGKTAGYWSPCYHVSPTSLTSTDFAIMNWYNTTHPEARFMSFLVVTKLRPDGSRRTVSYTTKAASENAKLKVWTKLGVAGDETDVVELDATEGNLWDVCEHEFGFQRQ